MIKSPSKHLSKKLLQQIAENNYQSAKADYCAEEVDKLLVERENSHAEKLVKQADEYFSSYRTLMNRIKFTHKKHDFIPALDVVINDGIKEIKFKPTLRGQIL